MRSSSHAIRLVSSLILIFSLHLFSLSAAGEVKSGDSERTVPNERLKELQGFFESGKLDQCLSEAVKALAAATAADQHQLRFELLHLIMRIRLEKRSFGDFEKRIPQYISLMSGNDTSVVKGYALLGMFYAERGKYAKSVRSYQKSLERIGKQKALEKLRFELQIQLGSVYGMMGDYKQELKHYMDSYGMIGAIKSHEDRSGLFNNIGAVYSSMADLEKALEFYRRALTLSKEAGDPEGEALALGNIGNTYLNQEAYSKALGYFQRALAISRKIDDTVGVAYTLVRLGDIYLSMKLLSKAESVAKEALKISEKDRDQLSMAEQYHLLGNIYTARKKYTSAESYLLKGLKIAETLKAKPMRLELYESLTNLYRERSDFKRAFEFSEKYIDTYEALYNEKSRNKIIEMQALYESLHQEQQIELLKREKYAKEMEAGRERLLRNGITAAVFGIVLFAFLLFNRYRLKKRAHFELEQAHRRLESANRLISEKNKHITDSLHYAQNIQLAILPLETKISHFVRDYFILYKPKDIVSGDFYWFNEMEGRCFMAVVDCTGHGVPGAFMSMIGYSLLNQILLEKRIVDPAEILNRLSDGVRGILKQDSDDLRSRDGMDVCLCVLDRKRGTLQFAGARRPLYYVRAGEASSDGTVTELKGVRRSAGGYRKHEKRHFVTETIPVTSGDIFYLSSDGFPDQASPSGEKFGIKRFKSLLYTMAGQDMARQFDIAEKALNTHQQEEEQRDDITLFGFRVE